MAILLLVRSGRDSTGAVYAFARHLQESCGIDTRPGSQRGSRAAFAPRQPLRRLCLVSGQGGRALWSAIAERLAQILPIRSQQILRRGGRMKISRDWVPVLVMASVLVALVQADAAHLKENARKHKIVYQLDDAGIDKAKFVLGNIRNHVSGVGGWQNVESLELVVFGPALKSFVQMEPALMELQEQGYIYLRP